MIANKFRVGAVLGVLSLNLRPLEAAPAEQSLPLVEPKPADQGIKLPARLVDGSLMTSDYPPEAYKVKAEGVTVAQFIISATGAVSECKALQTSGNPVLDDTTCSLIRTRFKFSPAIGFDGKPVVEVRRQRVVWVYPDLPAPKPFDYTWSVDIGLDGQLANCAVTGITPEKFSREKACTDLSPYAPPTDAAGRNVQKRMSVRYIMTLEDKSPTVAK